MRTTSVLSLAAAGLFFVASAMYFLGSAQWPAPRQAAAAATAITGTTSPDTTDQNGTSTAASDAVPDFSTTTYRYKIITPVDPCTLNALGQTGWKPVAFGTDSNGNYTGTYVGSDENCRSQRLYVGLVWVIFESSTSTTSNTLSTDATTYALYKIVQNVDPCAFNKLGAQGWRAIQFGTNLQYVGGYDETCKKAGLVNSLDWALFELPLQ